MEKCSTCRQNLCNGDYEKRHMCIDVLGRCKCSCQDSGLDTFLTAAAGIGATVLAVGIGAWLGGFFGGSKSSEDEKKRQKERVEVIEVVEVHPNAHVGTRALTNKAGSSRREKKWEYETYDRASNFQQGTTSAEPWEASIYPDSLPVAQGFFSEQSSLSREDQIIVDERLEEANSLSQETIYRELSNAKKFPELTSEIKELVEHKNKIRQIRDRYLDPSERHVQEQVYLIQNNLKGSIEWINERIKDLRAQAWRIKRTKIGRYNLHFLIGRLYGQIAMDMDKPGKKGPRGGRRVLAKYESHGQRFTYFGYTDDHDYDGAEKLLNEICSDDPVYVYV